MTQLQGNDANKGRGRKGTDGNRYRKAIVPRGWLEVSRDGGASWQIVAPGSLTIPADVRRAYLR